MHEDDRQNQTAVAQVGITVAFHWALVLGLAISGAAVTQFPLYDFLPLSEIFRPENWGSDLIPGAVAGATIGHFIWVIAKPRRRASHAAAVCVLANIFVWLSFLTFTPPLEDAEFSRVDKERSQRDANPSQLDASAHQPIVVASRWHGTYGALSFADQLLTFSAGPAIWFAELLIVPVRHIGIDATKRESFAIAGLGFVLSTSFWVALGDIVSALRRLYRRRTAKRSTTTA